MSDKYDGLLDSIAESFYDSDGNGVAKNMSEIAFALRNISCAFWPTGQVAKDPATGIAVGSIGEAIATISQSIANVADAINNLAESVSELNRKD
jgi:hypothetical protein